MSVDSDQSSTSDSEWGSEWEWNINGEWDDDDIDSNMDSLRQDAIKDGMDEDCVDLLEHLLYGIDGPDGGANITWDSTSASKIVVRYNGPWPWSQYPLRDIDALLRPRQALHDNRLHSREC
jgi:hypothetical protein